jgi:hypothetical protein
MSELRPSVFQIGEATDVELGLKGGGVGAQVNKEATAVTQFRVKTPTLTASTRGTVFSVRHDERTQLSTVAVEEGVVDVTPTNSSLRPFALGAGQQVQVAQNRVDPITSTAASTAPIGAGTTSPPPQPRFGPRADNTTFSGAITIRFFGTNDIEECEAACAANPQCKAYTFVKRAAYPSNPDNGVCYLSSFRGNQAHSPCCTSAERVTPE